MGEAYQIEINKLRTNLIKKQNWGPADQWHSSMFSELSQEVYEVTEVKLSSATLKRFFGVLKYDGTPSITTLDALSQFLGFENWRAFKLSKKGKFEGLKEGISHKFIYGIIGFVAALVFIFLMANRIPAEHLSIPEGITFSSRPVSTNYPNSVIFDFDLKDIQTDSLQIQQYWDVSKTISIRKEQNQATGIYYFPGHFEAKLMVDGEVAKRHDLFLRSNGWLGIVEYEPVPKYFAPVDRPQIELSFPELLKEEIPDSKDPLVIGYHYINDLGNVSGDDFELFANIRNAFDDRWAVCQSSSIYIIGTNGAMIIPFSKIGCSSDLNLMINDLYLNGKENDLSTFGTELDSFTSVRILNNKKRVSVFIEDEMVFSNSYSETMGDLVGLRFKFLGLGEVENFQLLDQNGNVVVL